MHASRPQEYLAVLCGLLRCSPDITCGLPEVIASTFSICRGDQHIQYMTSQTWPFIPVNIISELLDDWGSVVNCDFVQDPTICPPGFGLPRKQWCTLNCLRTNQGHSGACHKLWGLADSDLCTCGATQTMSHIVESCHVP